MIIEKASFSDQASLYDRLNQEKKQLCQWILLKCDKISMRKIALL